LLFERLQGEKEGHLMRRIWWLAVSVLVLCAVLLAPMRGRAEAKCPWLNAATAGGLLGGEASMTVSAPAEQGTMQHTEPNVYKEDQVRMDRFDVTCEFSRKADSAVYSLKIVVETMKDPVTEFAGRLANCPGTTVALRAIGNEAVQCVAKSGFSSGEEMVIARVRDRAFVLTVIRPPASTVPPAADVLHDDTRNIAEQIAGSLF
jgi:hypothetical protein